MKQITLILLALCTFSQADFSRDNSTGIVSDSLTLLEWQDNYSDNNHTVPYFNWGGAITYCNDLSLDGGGWRLPNINELKSIISETQFSPTIDVAFDKIETNRYYWSSTTYVGFSNHAWYVYFNNGNLNYYNKTYSCYVRCVRAGQ